MIYPRETFDDRKGHSCATCLEYQINKESGKLECIFESCYMACEKSCFESRTLVKWKPDNPLGIGKYACLKSRAIYDKLKAKIFNVLEAQLPPEPNDRRLKAAKSITEDIISDIADDVKEAILKAELPNKTINT